MAFELNWVTRRLCQLMLHLCQLLLESGGTAGSIKTMVKGISFAATRLDLPCLQASIKSPIVEGFMTDPSPKTIREAPPLPSLAVYEMERAILKPGRSLMGILTLGFALLCVYASLRFSDAQSVKPSSLFLSGWTLRGFAWKVKPDSACMPFACYVAGMLGEFPRHGWAHRWLLALDEWITRLPETERSKVDFLLPSPDSNGYPGCKQMPIEGFASRLRGILLKRKAVSLDRVLEYTTHSLKDTMLAWAKQFGANKDWAQS